MDLPVSAAKESLLKQIYSISTLGTTALGPATLASVILAAEHQMCSRVVVATDGEANCGLGNFRQSIDQSMKFYQDLGDLAASKGITLDLIAVIGDECNVQALSTMCERSGGLIHNVQANEFCDAMTESLSEKHIASLVTVKIQLHKCLRFRNEDPANLSQSGSVLTRKLGNASTDPLKFTFEYELKPVKDLLELELEEPLETYLQTLPFQLTCEYTQPDGTKFLRVHSLSMNTSCDKERLQNEANAEILSANAIQQASKLARIGEVGKAQAVAATWGKRLKGQADLYKKFKADFKPIYGGLNQARNQINSAQNVVVNRPKGKVSAADLKKKAKMVAMP